LRRSAFWGDVSKGRITEIERTVSKVKKKIKLSVSKSEANAKRSQCFMEAVDWIKRFKRLLGDRYYLELQMPGEEIPFGKEAFRQTALLSKKLGVPGVLTNDCHYLSRQDFKVQKCMMAIDQGLTINDPNLFHVNSDEQFFKSRAQLRQTFFEGGYDKLVPVEDFETFCDNSVEIAQKCSNFDPNLDPKLPSIEDADNKLRKLVIQELKTRNLINDTKKYKVDGKMVTYREQAMIEMERYIEKGFASYFLIIRDLIKFSNDKSWDIGPGRGSAGGSLVCYLLGIHSIDPLAWGLSSVRFMGDSRGGHMLRVKME
jgi:DNA polymerase-3 subunit alpha